jgi:integrase
MSGGYRIGRLTRKRADGSTYKSFCVKWTDDEGPHRYSLGTQDRASAEAEARDFWNRRALVQLGTVGDVVEAYLKVIAASDGHKRKAEAWIAAKPFWGGMRIGNIVPDAKDQHGSGRAYAAWRQKAANTVRKETGLVIEALSWAKDKEFIERAPKLYIPPIPPSEVEHLNRREFRKFLAGCKAPHVRLFVQLAIATGARSKALLELSWMRVDLERRLINLNPKDRIQKANKGRATVPINDQLLAALKEAKEAALSPFVIELGGERILSIRKGFEAASERSGVHCTPHMLRHSAAVWMAEARTPMEEIASYLGHKDTRITTSTYARFSPDYLRRAAKVLEY